VAEVEASNPTDGRPSFEPMMAVWSPGFYRVEDDARKVEGLSARTPAAAPLPIEHPTANRWWIAANGTPRVVVSYRFVCDRRSVTMNWVTPDLVVLNSCWARRSDETDARREARRCFGRSHRCT